ncbi:MAG: hypothetical protein ACRDSZ_20445 [Pseudonocardiaceae bacterium]
MATVLLAVVLFGAVTALLVSLDPTTSGSEAIRTGRLVSAAVVALYALWLNDRRRRVEESRHELERRSNEQQREQVADERFARAVELLGHEADQVRVGALHALAGLARSQPSYAQTVLDVICSYLRRPFDHPDYVQARTAERPQWEPADEQAADRERQVRLAAQRVIGELVPDRRQEPGTLPNLDLTGALLDYIDLSGKAYYALPRGLGGRCVPGPRRHAPTSAQSIRAPARCALRWPAAWHASSRRCSGRIGSS